MPGAGIAAMGNNFNALRADFLNSILISFLGTGSMDRTAPRCAQWPPNATTAFTDRFP
jgi:hypothetical protein